MDHSSFVPRTVGDIKRMAKAIKRTTGCKHMDALHQASQRAGYANYVHAERVLVAQPVKPNGTYTVYLSCHWRDPNSRIGGQEVLTISLPAPLSQVIRKEHIPLARGLGNFRLAAPDHLESKSGSRDQTHARDRLISAWRSLMFISATGLRPSSGISKAYPNGKHDNRLPGSDHSSVWFDAERRYLLTDEPYSDAVERREEERQRWANRFGYDLVKAPWRGIHNPEPVAGTVLYLASDRQKGVPLGPIVEALSKLPQVLIDRDWETHGKSLPRVPIFISPGAKSVEDEAPRKAPARPPVPKNTTVEFVETFVGARRRPNKSLPVAMHREFAHKLKQLTALAYWRKSASNNFEKVRSELDEWVMREHDRSSLPDEEFHELYFGGDSLRSPRKLSAEEKSTVHTLVQEMKALLVANYPDCAPVRRLVGLLESGEKSIASW